MLSARLTVLGVRLVEAHLSIDSFSLLQKLRIFSDDCCHWRLGLNNCINRSHLWWQVHILRKVANLNVLAGVYFTFIGRILTRKEPQETGLPTAICTNKCHTVPTLQHEVQVVEQNSQAVMRLAYPFYAHQHICCSWRLGQCEDAPCAGTLIAQQSAVVGDPDSLRWQTKVRFLAHSLLVGDSHLSYHSLFLGLES